MSNKSEKIEIGGKGIKTILKNYKPEHAIAEYIWNGFDAQATEIKINFEEINDLGGLNSITVSDNGAGIPQELLDQKFKPFFESEKSATNPDGRHHSLAHGRNGRGRLTFFTFANQATWTTTYLKDKKYYEYDIQIVTQNLESYSGSNTKLRAPTKNTSGTVVRFDGIRELTKSHLLKQIKDYLKQEFGWFLEMYKSKGLSIKINGEALEYEDIIGDRDETNFLHQETGTNFKISFIRWNQSLQNEYSCLYLIGSNGNENWKDTTKLNNKGDNFYHSVYIQSAFFDDFTYDLKQKDDEHKLFGKSKNDDAYKFLEKELTNYLRRKRKPFLKEFAEKLVEEYEKEGIIPEFQNDWEQVRKTELEDVVKGLYQIQPKIFNASSIEQKKTFVRFLNALLDSDERDQILKIINEVVDLDYEERKELLNLLQTTKLSGIIRTIKLVTDRYKVADQLNELVFKTELKANERDHLQKLVDEHYWLFGEQYHLVTTTEAKFEKALRNYTYLLTGENKNTKINHPGKNKEMDIFLCKQNKLTETIENIVVELKSPSINLGKKEVDQVLNYMQVILKQPEFNAKNMFWEFYLVGNKFDTSGWIEQLIENKKEAGESKKGLIHAVGNYKVYVKTWSEIFTDFKCRHKFLEERLKLERDNLSKEYDSADQIVEESKVDCK